MTKQAVAFVACSLGLLRRGRGLKFEQSELPFLL